MMVIPQIPSLRPVAVIAAFFIFILSILSISNYITFKEDKAFLEQEKRLVLNELSEMIDSYDFVDVLNDSLRFQLNQSKEKLVAIMDSVKAFKPNETSIARFKAQIKILKIENRNILSFVKNLESENQSLKNERLDFEKTLKARDSLNKLIESKYNHLLEKNDNLSEYRKLFVSNLSIEGAKRITAKNRVVDTRYANRTKKFHIKFTIVKNNFLNKGLKTFYFQIMDSKMNVISDRGTINFGQKSLIYSGVKTVNYTGEELTVSAIINKKEEEKLDKGLYYIALYYKGNLISKTTMTLK